MKRKQLDHIAQSPSKNKKVKNATEIEVGEIKFRSKLEAECYNALKIAGFNPKYEIEKTTLLEGFYPNENLLIYLPKISKGRVVGFERDSRKVRSTTITPDFTFEHKGCKIIIETKGNPNDAYPNRRKMYFKILNEVAKNQKVLFFEPRNKKQIEETIKIIQSL